MIIPNTLGLGSRVFEPGRYTKHLDFAVRGLPRVYLPAEQYVNYGWAVEQYAPAIQTLDRLQINLPHFTSGVTGAALIMLTLYPQTESYWRDLADKRIYLDQDGFSAAGLLYYYLERHRSIQWLTRRSDYQLWLFHCALALSSAWLAKPSDSARYRRLPPVPDAATLIEQVAAKLVQKNSKDGFRAASLIRAHTHLMAPPRIAHTIDTTLIHSLVSAAEGRGRKTDPTQTDSDALNWLQTLKPDAELAHPAALAAATVSIARYSQAKSVWKDVLEIRGHWQPSGGGRWEANIAGMILRCIMDANRAKDARVAAAQLYERILGCFQLRDSLGDVMRRNAPRLEYTAKILDSWSALSVNFQPDIVFDTPYNNPPDSSDEQKKKKNQRSGQRKRSRHAARRRLQTGLAGEEHFLKNYHSVLPTLKDLVAIDRRHHASGYDVLFLEQDGHQLVELKTVRPGRCQKISFTRRQWETARTETTDYWLVVVILHDDKEPEMIAVNNPAAKLDPVRREAQITQITHEVPVAQVVTASQADQTRLA